MKDIVLKKGRDNLAATIFVPYNCTNNCSFCTSKSMYKNCPKDGDLILKMLDRIINKLDIPDIVITGGEPFSNLNFLQKMIDVIENKNIFINTTLPILYPNAENDILNFIKKNPKITGINVSRHRNSFKEDIINFSPNIFTDELIGKIDKPVKINCVIQDGISIPVILDRWSKFKNCRLSLRADYTKITNANLKSLDDDVISTLLLYCSYVSHGGCDVCFDVKFKYNKLDVSYHKGLEFSSIQIGNTILVNDIIIKPNGACYYDWDDKEIPDLLNNIVKYFGKKKTTPKPNVNSTTKSTPIGFRSSCGGNTLCGVTYNASNSNSSKSLSSCGSSYSSCGGGSHC